MIRREARAGFSRSPNLGVAGVVAALVGVTIYVYSAIGHHTFVNFDDLGNVIENPAVNHGLSQAGLVWAFTTAHTASWIPVTWLSHMADCQLFGLASAPPHIEQVVWHVLTTLILFALLRQTTGCVGRSAFVAAVFAVHPVHVESVAWLSERKDVLSAFFGLVTLWAYVAFVARRTWSRYLLVVTTYAIGLMAKPMLVTLPCLLLLLDLWPLGRLGVNSARGDQRRRILIGDLLREKAPLFAMAVVWSVIAVLSQRRSRAMVGVGLLPIHLRIENAIVAYVRYVRELVWPVRLAAFYPWPTSFSLIEVIAAALALVGVTLLLVRQMRHRPYLLVGWLWYLGVLVPVLGLVQVGAQALADRYLYLPSIGLLIMIAWGVPDLWEASHLGTGRPAAAVASVLAIATLAVVAKQQVTYWSDSVTLWRRAVAVSPASYRLHFYLATALDESGQFAPAVVEYTTAVRLAPRFVEGRDDLSPAPSPLTPGFDEIEAVRSAPSSAGAHNRYGHVLSDEGRRAEAMGQYEEALLLRPDFADAYANEGDALTAEGEEAWATQAYEAAVRLDPNHAEWQFDLATLLVSANRPADALPHLEKAVHLDPHLTAATALLKTIRPKRDEER